jgi:ferrous iron transport protein A
VVPIRSVRVGDRGRVVLIRSATSTVQRLMAIGLVPGTQVSVVRVAPLGDPIILDAGGFQLSLRRREAEGLGLELIARP